MTQVAHRVELTRARASYLTRSASSPLMFRPIVVRSRAPCWPPPQRPPAAGAPAPDALRSFEGPRWSFSAETGGTVRELRRRGGPRARGRLLAVVDTVTLAL
jgi:hypothetical protein